MFYSQESNEGDGTINNTSPSGLDEDESRTSEIVAEEESSTSSSTSSSSTDSGYGPGSTITSSPPLLPGILV